jgi:hypothetical protein
LIWVTPTAFAQVRGGTAAVWTISDRRVDVAMGYPRTMTESPVDPTHDDHGEDPEETSGENPDGTHDQDAEPPTSS